MHPASGTTQPPSIPREFFSIYLARKLNEVMRSTAYTAEYVEALPSDKLELYKMWIEQATGE